MNKNYSYFIFILLILSCNCRTDCENFVCELDWVDMPTKIKQYHEINNTITSNKSLDKPNIYIDFSDGLKYVFADDNSSEVFESFLGRAQTLNDKTSFYTIDGENHKELTQRRKELWNFMLNERNYSLNYAQIDFTLDTIVKRVDELSVLITDGELYTQNDKEHLSNPWAHGAIKEWLGAGNTISCFVTNHFDKAVDREKHLFYLIFVPKDFDNRYVESLKNELGSKCSFHSFNTNLFTQRTNYASPSSPTAHGYLDLNKNDYEKEDNYEYIELYTPFSDACQDIVNTFDEKGDLIDGGGYVLRDLFIDVEPNSFYYIKGVKIIVEDIKDDLTNLDCQNQCEGNKDNILMYTDVNTSENLLDPENNDCIIYYCFDEKGNMKKDQKYTPASNLKEIKNFLIINENLFKTGLSSGSAEIGIKLDPEVMNCYFENKGTDNLWKVSIVLNYDLKSKEEIETALENFKWQTKTSSNNALANSFRQALKDVKKEEKIIYTYYIKSTL